MAAIPTAPHYIALKGAWFGSNTVLFVSIIAGLLGAFDASGNIVVPTWALGFISACIFGFIRIARKVGEIETRATALEKILIEDAAQRQALTQELKNLVGAIQSQQRPFRSGG